jgi:hypothetical protein
MFADMLRAARSSRVAVLHEFRTQYDPSRPRLHLFFEGQDDVPFFKFFVEKYSGRDTRIFIYRCDGKAKVYDAFRDVVEQFPGVKSALFFVDKDVDDILGVPWPTDPRIYVTDAYSIESYVTTRESLQKFFASAVRLRDVQFDEAPIFEHFERQRRRFSRLMLPLMAWIILLRRSGERPHLNNIKLHEVFGFSDECAVFGRVGKRLSHLASACLVKPRTAREILPTARDLARMQPARIVRGKFMAWFVAEFWKRLVTQLEALAKEANGKVTIKPQLDRTTLVATLTPYTDIPRSLQLFLEAHLTPPSPRPSPSTWKDAIARVLQQVVRTLTGP